VENPNQSDLSLHEQPVTEKLAAPNAVSSWPGMLTTGDEKGGALKRPKQGWVHDGAPQGRRRFEAYETIISTGRRESKPALGGDRVNQPNTGLARKPSTGK